MLSMETKLGLYGGRQRTLCGRECVFCKKVYWAPSYCTRKFCSLLCSVRWNSDRNAEKKTHVCLKCGSEKIKSEFRKNSSRSCGVQSYCKLCEDEFKKELYAANKEKFRGIARTNRNRNRRIVLKFLMEYLGSNHCVDCGESDPVVLEFDHVRGVKIDSVAQMVGHGKTLDSLKSEIAKCDVRCANCHRRKTAKAFGWRKLELMEPHVTHR